MSRVLSARVVNVVVEFYNSKITKGSWTGRTNLKSKELVFYVAKSNLTIL